MKKRTTKRGAQPRQAEKDFDEGGMSPLHDVQMRTFIGGPTKFDLSQTPLRITFEACCRMHATTEEIAHLFGVTQETLKINVKKWYRISFREVYALKKSEGRMSLRRAQWMSAIADRNTTMMIWLGKQELGQKDKFDIAPIDDGSGESMTFYIPVISRPVATAEPKPNEAAGVHVSDE